MSGILSQLKTVAKDLRELNVKYALVGGLAFSVHAEPRTTRDIDVAVVFDDDESGDKAQCDFLVDKLIEKGYSKKQLILTAMPTQHLGIRVEISSTDPSLSLPLDILYNSSGIEAEIVEEAEIITIFPGLDIPVVKKGHLIAMKLLAQNDTDRANDRVDLQKLLRVADETDLALAWEAIKLIEKRGYNRDKNLAQEFETFL